MNKELNKFIEELFMLVRHGDFSNGITGEGGYPDEGDVRSREIIERLEKQWTVFKVAKTEKQIISGYHRPVCVKCHCELRPETNGVGILDIAEWGPYELYDADLWKCPSCGIEVVGGFALSPISAHYNANFQKMIDSYKNNGVIIENKG
jgi:hypothetical protein